MFMSSPVRTEGYDPVQQREDSTTMMVAKVSCKCPLVTAARPVARRGSCDGFRATGSDRDSLADSRQ